MLTGTQAGMSPIMTGTVLLGRRPSADMAAFQRRSECLEATPSGMYLSNGSYNLEAAPAEYVHVSGGKSPVTVTW